jgi:protein involved in polysaccharide export with SLBB domain
MNEAADKRTESGRQGLARRAAACLLLLALALGLVAGCATTQPQVDKSLMADRGGLARNEGVADRYLIGCPDVLEVVVAGRPELAARGQVGADGCADLGALGKPRVEGRTAPEVARSLAGGLRLPPAYVDVRVAEFNSQCLYLFGEVNGLQRAVAYRGQETVLDLLQRVGGITAGAAPDDVYVVRSRIAEGQRPEVFSVDLRAIVVEHDHRTNLRLLPFDQVHIGATRRARLEKCVPPWLRPLFRALCGQFPTPHAEHRKGPEMSKPSNRPAAGLAG